MPSRLRRHASRMVVDVRPLRHSPHFRRLWLGQLVSVVGRQITTVAVPYQVYQLTHSPLWVGSLGLLQAVPMVAVAMLAGPLVDRIDRRRVLLITQTLLALCSLALALNALPARPRLWPILVVVALAAAVSALDSPSRTAIIPNLVEPDHLVGALSLNFALFQAAVIGGPALAGAILARFGLGPAYLLDAVSFAAAWIAVALLPAQRPLGAADPDDRGLRAVRRGMRFAGEQPVISGGFAMDLVAMTFGMPRALFPVLAATRFSAAGTVGLGLLYAAIGLGSLLATTAAGWIRHLTHMGRVIVCAVLAWGGAIVAFGLAPSLPWALLALVAAGAADSYSAVARNSSMQLLTPDHLRGRLSALYYTVVAAGPNLGDLESGVVAAAISVPVSIISGGLLCIAGAGVVAGLFPGLWRQRFDELAHPPGGAGAA